MPYPVTPPSKREYLSFSQLSSAATCGEMYRRKYIEGEEVTRWNLPALCGTAFHEAVRLFELRTHATPDGVLATMTDEFARSLSSSTVEAVQALLAHYDLEVEDVQQFGKQDFSYWCDTKIPQIAKSYLDQRQLERETGWRFYDDDPEGSSEMELTAEVGGHQFIAYLDQVMVDSRGRVVIRDLKTGKPKPGHAMQLEQYRLALLRDRGIVADYGQLLYLHNAAPHPQVVRFNLADRDIDILTGRQERAIGENLWLVNGPFSGACDTCDFRPTCRWGQVTVHGSS